MDISHRVRTILFTLFISTLSIEANAGFWNDILNFFVGGAKRQVETELSLPSTETTPWINSSSVSHTTGFEKPFLSPMGFQFEDIWLFEEALLSLIAETAALEFWFLLIAPQIIEKLYTAWTMQDQERFVHILVNPLDTYIPLGMDQAVANKIASQFFPQQLQNPNSNNHHKRASQRPISLKLLQPECEPNNDRQPLRGGGSYKIDCAYETKEAFRNLPLIAVLQTIMSQISQFKSTPARFLDENDINMVLPAYGMQLTGRDQIIPNTSRQVQLFEINTSNQGEPSYFSNQVLIRPNNVGETPDLQRSVQYWLNLVQHNHLTRSNFCLTLNVNNVHWVALCFRYNNGLVTWQLADSNAVHDQQGANAAVNAVRQLISQLSSANHAINFDERNFVISNNDYQSRDSNNCGLFALAYIQQMLQDGETSNLTQAQLETLQAQGNMLRGSHNSYTGKKTIRLVDKHKISADDILLLSQKKPYGYDLIVISLQNGEVLSRRHSGDFDTIQIPDDLDLKAVTAANKQGVFANNIYYVHAKNNSVSENDINETLMAIKSSLENMTDPNNSLIKALNNSLRDRKEKSLDNLSFLPINTKDAAISHQKFSFNHGKGKLKLKRTGFEEGLSSYTTFNLNSGNGGALICGRRFDSDHSSQEQRREIITTIGDSLCIGGNIRLDHYNEEKITQTLRSKGIESIYCSVADGVQGGVRWFEYEDQTIQAAVYVLSASYFGQRWALNCGAGYGRTTAMLGFSLMILSEDYYQGYLLATEYVNYQRGIDEAGVKHVLNEFILNLYEFDQYLEKHQGSNQGPTLLSIFGLDKNYNLIEQLKAQGLVAKGKLTIKGRLHLLKAVLAYLKQRENWDYSNRITKDSLSKDPILPREKNAFYKYILTAMVPPHAKM